ncbi:hypothetical protein D3C84_347520 [compost metagenome]
MKTRYADGAVAVVDPVGAAFDFGLHQRRTAQQAQAIKRLAIDVQLHAFVLLLAIDPEDPVLGVARRLFDAVHTQARAIGVHVQAHAGFDLLAAHRGEGLVAVDRAGRRRRALGQAFDAVGVERNVFPWLDHQAIDRGGDRLFVA